MNSFPDNRAATLRDAYRICTPEPLIGQDIERYYVDLSAIRSTKAIQNLTKQLEFLDPSEFCTILFTGHRGCGKSTELRKIQKQLESEYYIVYLEADVELDINDAEYTDLYLLIIKKIADELYKLGAKFDKKLLTSFESWFKEITNETEASVEQAISSEVNVEVGLKIPFISKLLAKLLAQIKGSQKQKQVIRQTLQKDISRLQADLTASGNKITAEDVTYAIKEEQFNFERITLNEYYSFLAQVCLTKNINKDGIGQLLLFNLSILEYNGASRWNYINPVIKSSPLFQEALQNEQQQSGNI